jgi:hypothetical protein
MGMIDPLSFACSFLLENHERISVKSAFLQTNMAQISSSQEETTLAG